MRGGSSASNLTGLLGSIGDTIGEMGEPGRQYIDTFRRQQAPSVDMGSSDSLLNYAEWARRNGYDDEAEKYLALGYKQKAIEGEKAYKTGVARGGEKLRGFDTSLAELDRQVRSQEELGVVNPALLTARDKVVTARKMHIQSMNDLGKASDFGDGTEGSSAERALLKEDMAAEKAAIEREKSINELKLQRDELAELAQKSERIPDYLLPPAAREAYGAAYLAAKNSPTDPEQAMRDVNARFRKPGEDYIAGLGKGDPTSIAAVASAEKQLREIDPDIAQWLADPANEKLVKYAREETAAALAKNPDYRTASKEGKAAMAADTFRKILRGYGPGLDEAVEDIRQDLISDGASDTRAAKVKTEDYVRGYPEGWQPGGPEYMKQFEAAKKADGEDFDSQAFADAWDATYYRPDGMRAGTNSSPTSRIMSKGPY